LNCGTLLNSFLGIWFFQGGSAQKIIGTDTIKISQFADCVYRIVQYTDFILGVSVLADPQMCGYSFLGVATVNSQIADIFELQNFVSHSITQ